MRQCSVLGILAPDPHIPHKVSLQVHEMEVAIIQLLGLLWQRGMYMYICQPKLHHACGTSVLLNGVLLFCNDGWCPVPRAPLYLGLHDKPG